LELRRLDAFDVLAIDDIGYIQQDRDEMEVPFTLLAERYERKSVVITSILVFSQWDRILKDPMTTAAAIDRIIHHFVQLRIVPAVLSLGRQSNPYSIPFEKITHPLAFSSSPSKI